MSDRDGLFAEAKKKRAQEKESENRKKSGQFQEVTYGPLYMNDYSSYRIFGNPANNRMGDATSPKLVHYSMIRGDDDKLFRCVWPDPTEGVGKNWLLWKVFYKVCAYKWENEDRNYYHKDSHPTVFNRVHKNGRPDIKFERGWNPHRVVVMNVRDLRLIEWHREEKKTALIARKVSHNEKTDSYFYEPGITLGIYNEIWDELVENYGDWENFDVVIYKTDELPFYKAYHGADEFKKLQGKNELFNDKYPEIATALMTDEERAWERWDIDKLFPITSFTKITSRLGTFIKLVDQTFNTKFTEELEELTEQEKKEREANKEETKEESNSPTPVSSNVLNDEFDEDDDSFVDKTSEAIEKAGDVFEGVDETEDIENTKEEIVTNVGSTAPPVRVSKRKAAKPSTELSWEELEKLVPNVSKLTDENKALITGYDDKMKTFTYVEGENIFSCPSDGCSMQTPESFTHCPSCGVEFAD